MTDQEIIKKLQDEINKEFREATQELIKYAKNKPGEKAGIKAWLHKLADLHLYSETLWECWAIARKKND